jgi:hypothetical protein
LFGNAKIVQILLGEVFFTSPKKMRGGEEHPRERENPVYCH